MVIENVDYVFIPSDEKENPRGWDIRVLTGDYVETVIRYGKISWDGTKAQLSYNYNIVSSPIDDLKTDDYNFLESTVTPILSHILEHANENGTIDSNSETS